MGSSRGHQPLEPVPMVRVLEECAVVLTSAEPAKGAIELFAAPPQTLMRFPCRLAQASYGEPKLDVSYAETFSIVRQHPCRSSTARLVTAGERVRPGRCARIYWGARCLNGAAGRMNFP